jgi:ribosome-binding protein aMBF1 (putative translation factor)
MQMAHISEADKKEKTVLDSLREIESKPEIEKPDDLVFKLVDNFHWIIQTERRRKGITARQLAQTIGESENAILLLEKGIIPSKSMDLIRSLEQILKVKLIKRDLIEQIQEKKVLEEKRDLELARIKKEGFVSTTPSKVVIPQNVPEKHNPLSFNKKETENFNVNDLQKLSKKIDEDMEFDKKTRQQVGEEQLDRFGKEELDNSKRKIYSSVPSKPKNTVPTIYDLMKRKQEKDKSEIRGGEIQMVKDSSNKAKWAELE